MLGDEWMIGSAFESLEDCLYFVLLAGFRHILNELQSIIGKSAALLLVGVNHRA